MKHATILLALLGFIGSVHATQISDSLSVAGDLTVGGQTTQVKDIKISGILQFNGAEVSEGWFLSDPFTYTWSTQAPAFTSGVANQVTYLTLGDQYSGSLQVTIQGTYNNATTPCVGRLVKKFYFVKWANSGFANSSSRLVENFGTLDQFIRIGSPEVGPDNKIRIPIYNLTSYQIIYWAQVTGFNTVGLWNSNWNTGWMPEMVGPEIATNPPTTPERLPVFGDVSMGDFAN